MKQERRELRRRNRLPQPVRRGDCRAYASARRLQAPPRTATPPPASTYRRSRSIAASSPSTAIASVRTIITVAGSLRASSAALIFPAISSPETSAAFGRRKELRKSRITWAILSRRSAYGSLAASTSTFSMAGAVAKSSDAFAISAAATLPER